jgi:hypothetical protein
VIGSPGVKKRRQILKKIKDEKIKTKDGQPSFILERITLRIMSLLPT